MQLGWFHATFPNSVHQLDILIKHASAGALAWGSSCEGTCKRSGVESSYFSSESISRGNSWGCKPGNGKFRFEHEPGESLTNPQTVDHQKVLDY